MHSGSASTSRQLKRTQTALLKPLWRLEAGGCPQAIRYGAERAPKKKSQPAVNVCLQHDVEIHFARRMSTRSICEQ